MHRVGTLLARYAHLEAPESAVRNAVILFCKECVGVEVEPYEVQYRNKTVRILAHPTIRSEVLLRKGELVRFLKERGVRVEAVQ